MLSKSLYTDVERGKRDDNYRPSKNAPGTSGWDASTEGESPLDAFRAMSRRRRLLLILVVVGVVYLFVHNMPTTDVADQRRLDREKLGYTGYSQRGPAQFPEAPTGPPPRTGNAASMSGRDKTLRVEEQEHYYSGPIKFYKLKASLDSISQTGGYRPNNRNILFVASSLRSAANLLPLVCEMARLGENHVHLAVLGRAALDLDVLLELNGYSRKNCKAWFHDGRADYSEYSTDVRAEASVVGAINHIYNYMHPQAVIVDDEQLEDTWFIRAVRHKMGDFDRPVILIPAGMYNDFKWITRLDSASLSFWHKPRIEVLIRSPANSGGGLLRLLKSLETVNFGGFRPPKLTIELPDKVDDYLAEYVAGLRWPPNSASQYGEADLLKVQRRVPNTAMSAEEASVRFVESYYPSHQDDHVLLLSSQAALSPQAWQFMMYTLLQSRYSAYGGLDRERLAGLTLSAPSHTLDGKSTFTPPLMKAMRTKTTLDNASIKSPPFLWAAAHGDATLIFGDRWAEFHDYLTRRLYSHHKYPTTSKQTRLLSKQHPVWLEFFHELMTARAWRFLYPADSNAGTWATIHAELAISPDETRQNARPSTSTVSSPDSPPTSASEPFLRADPAPVLDRYTERQIVSSAQPLHELLPLPSSLTPLSLSDLPLLDLHGDVVASDAQAEEAAIEAVVDLRKRIGGCDADAASRPRRIVGGKTGDLFCFMNTDALEAQAWEIPVVDFRLFDEGDESMREEVAKATKQRKASTKKEVDGEDDMTTSAGVGKVETEEEPLSKATKKLDMGAADEHDGDEVRRSSRASSSAGDD